MDVETRASLEKQLGSWLVGRRRAAVESLAKDGSREAVPLLVRALGDKNEEVRAAAREALGSLKGQDAVDALCVQWMSSRDPALAAIIREQRFVAQEPPEAHILSAFCSGQTPRVNNRARLKALEAAIDDKETDLAKAARDMITGQKDSAILDILTKQAINDPRGKLAQLCIESGFRNTDDATNCVYLLVTGQLDAYFSQQDDFEHVRRAYDKADEALRANIMRVVQSGDLRFQKFFKKGTRRHERDETDILAEVQTGLHHQNWPQLFELFLEAPMKYSYPILEHFRRAGWEPPEAPEGSDEIAKKRAEARRSLYRAVLQLSDGFAVTPGAPAPEKQDNSLRSVTLDPGPMAKEAAKELIARIESAPPMEAMVAVAALAQQGTVDEQTRNRIQNHEHWPVRLAGRLTGLCPASAFANDPIYWVREGIAPDTRKSFTLDLWPSRAQPEDVQLLQDLPPAAFEGRLGAVRAVLRVVLASGVKAAIIEQDQAAARQQAAVVDEED